MPPVTVPLPAKKGERPQPLPYRSEFVDDAARRGVDDPVDHRGKGGRDERREIPQGEKREGEIPKYGHTTGVGGKPVQGSGDSE